MKRDSSRIIKITEVELSREVKQVMALSACLKNIGDIMRESEPVPRMDLWRGGGCRVPESIGKCPECGGQLEVLCMSWDEVTGQPIAPDLEIVCLDEPLNDGDSGINHSWNQSRWQPVKDAISNWAEASQSSYNKIVGLGSSAQ